MVLVLVAGLLLAGCGAGSDAGGPQPELATATQGTLSISVTEGGDLESANPISLRSHIEKRTAILDMIPEGSLVKKGDFLLKLDSADLEDRLNRAESDLEKARSDQAQAEESLQIQVKQNKESVQAAETDKMLSRRALTGYLEGEYPLARRQNESDILLAEAELARSKEKWEASKRLFKKNYISRTELEVDEIDYKRRKENRIIAERNLDLLEKWTKPDKLKRLESDVSLAELALTRVMQQASSGLIQKRDALAARKRNYELQLEVRDKLKRQLGEVVLRAPQAGLVVYGRARQRHGTSEPIAVGKEVREGEELMRIPDLEHMVVEVDIHESSIKKVKPGQAAAITVDAIPGQSFPGTVERVSLVPSSQSSWMNPDLKVYTCRVRVDTSVPDIKPGMHAQVKIFVRELKDITQVPLPAVHQVGPRSFVYIPAQDAAELREVTVGASNESMVQIVKGLAAGEKVFLVPPANRPALPEARERKLPRATAQAPRSRVKPAAAARKSGGRRGGTRGMGQMTEAEQAKLRARLARMTAEERRAYFKRMSDQGTRQD